ncbi:MAG: DivIVA domain-containing protein, partial [Actinomycetota bacterium]|nr:DivIVA domain-containing protein [Actinomycetota bacterium]
MASDRVNVEEGSLSADLIARQSFSTVRRGFDPEEVRQFLAKLAAEILALSERQAWLEDELRTAEYRVAHPIIDEETILSAVGEGTAHILRSAHEAAADIKSRAEENASRILKEAHQKADAVRGEAETVLARRTEEAEGVAARITDAAKLEADRLGDQARQQAKAIRAQSDAERQAMIDGAQATREKILTHLARKRKVAVVQVEQLLAGRERLLESYQVVRETLDAVTAELAQAETAARAAADAIRLRPMAIDEPDTGENPVVGREAQAIDSIAGRLSTRDIDPRPATRATAAARPITHAPGPQSPPAAGRVMPQPPVTQ